MPLPTTRTQRLPRSAAPSGPLGEQCLSAGRRGDEPTAAPSRAEPSRTESGPSAGRHSRRTRLAAGSAPPAARCSCTRRAPKSPLLRSMLRDVGAARSQLGGSVRDWECVRDNASRCILSRSTRPVTVRARRTGRPIHAGSAGLGQEVTRTTGSRGDRHLSRSRTARTSDRSVRVGR